jgi:hypothetical protein
MIGLPVVEPMTLQFGGKKGTHHKKTKGKKGKGKKVKGKKGTKKGKKH